MSSGSQHKRTEVLGELTRELRQFTGLGASFFRAAAARIGITATDMQVIDIVLGNELEEFVGEGHIYAMIRLIGHWQSKGQVEKSIIFVQGTLISYEAQGLTCDSTRSQSNRIKTIIRRAINAKPSHNQHHLESLSRKF